VIYVLCFRDIDDGKSGNSAFYIGKTINAGQRFDAHHQALNDPTAPGQAYVTGRKAREWRMMVLIDITSTSLEHRDMILRIMEHTGVSLFHSWTPVLLFNDFEDADQAEKWISDTSAAQMCTQLAVTVFAKTGWRKPSERGLNWKTPLLEMRLRHTAWTVQQINDEKADLIRIHRTTPRKVHFSGNNRRVVLIRDGADARGRVTLALPDDDIEDGSYINVIVEIYTGKSQRHQVPYARLPEPGPFSDWDDLNRIG
jgi:hypothetical protein